MDRVFLDKNRAKDSECRPKTLTAHKRQWNFNFKKEVFKIDHRTINVLFSIIAEEYDSKVEPERLALEGLCRQRQDKKHNEL